MNTIPVFIKTNPDYKPESLFDIASLAELEHFPQDVMKRRFSRTDAAVKLAGSIGKIPAEIVEEIYKSGGREVAQFSDIGTLVEVAEDSLDSLRVNAAIIIKETPFSPLELQVQASRFQSFPAVSTDALANYYRTMPPKFAIVSLKSEYVSAFEQENIGVVYRGLIPAAIIYGTENFAVSTTMRLWNRGFMQRYLQPNVFAIIINHDKEVLGKIYDTINVRGAIGEQVVENNVFTALVLPQELDYLKTDYKHIAELYQEKIPANKIRQMGESVKRAALQWNNYVS